jgi:heat-inducible transcriptional repressor
LASRNKLDERKKSILKVVTDDYIASAEPVGSRTIARRYNLGLSPATIRNEMADLEEGGYLEQPHTSAGRIPSEVGYRYYVDALISLQKLTHQEVENIYKEMEGYHREIESIIHQTSKILVQMTKYPSVVLSPQFKTAIFRHIQLVKLSATTVLVLIVTDTGYVENKMIELQTEVSTEELDRISELLNKKLRGISLKDLQSTLLNDIRSELVLHDQFFNESVKLLIKAIANRTSDRVYIDGALKILEQPEFSDLQKFKPLMNALEEEDRLYKLLSRNPGRGAQVKIGHENDELGLNDCSVITSSYEIAGRTVGVIGVLGPTRMDYAKVVPIVEYTSSILSELLTMISKRTSR